MAQKQGKKGKRPRMHKFTDPLVAARRNLGREITKALKKMRHLKKRGEMDSRRENVLTRHVNRLKSRLGEAMNERTPDTFRKAAI